MERDDPMVHDDVLLAQRSGNVLVLTLNRPGVRNALNPELKDRLIDAMHGADDGPDVRVVVLTGNGPVFCAGMSAVFRSADAMEGARAFADRRPPVWTGK